MRIHPSSWTSLFARLGFSHKKPGGTPRTRYTRQLRCEQCEDRRMLAPIVVNSWLDNGDGSKTTLREAIDEANFNPDHNTITFDPNVFNIPRTILLTLGELSIAESVTIDGRNQNSLQQSLRVTIDAQQNSRIFDISTITSGEIVIDDLTLTRGKVTSMLGGGAIRSRSDLTVRNATITGNTTSIGAGGGIIAYRALNIENSTISGNSTDGDGGGIAFTSNDDVTLNVVSSIINGNSAASRGGGIFIEGDAATTSIDASHIVNNESQSYGGGLFFSSNKLSILSTEIHDNTSHDHGGGIYATTPIFATDPEITITDSTLSLNRAIDNGSDGGGAYLVSDGAPVAITNCLVSDNRALGLESNVGGLAVIVNSGGHVEINGLRSLNNHADDDVGGLLIENDASTVVVKKSTISGNSASHLNWNQITYDAGGGVWLEAKHGGVNTIESTTISSNTSYDRGGGIFIRNSNGVSGPVTSSKFLYQLL